MEQRIYEPLNSGVSDLKMMKPAMSIIFIDANHLFLIIQNTTNKTSLPWNCRMKYEQTVDY
jgi:hypothetical protein